ncbi:MAG TPA: 3-phosphoshikimate 1-carboxyvinyltransferase [Pyrinomonadaceae bacterium]
MRIEPARRIRGRLRLPGDKSISHRAAIISALADGRSRIENFSTSRDCAATLECLRLLGVSIEQEGASVRVEGVGLRGLRANAVLLDCGNSGSTMRMLAGVLAGQRFTSSLTGDDSLCSRPMRRIIEPLVLMGARIASTNGCAPLSISGGKPLAGITYEMPVASAQVKSCLLLAGLNASGQTLVREMHGLTRDHTERMMRWFGIDLETESGQRGDGADIKSAVVRGGVHFAARDVSVPGDISSATFFIAAAALLPGSELVLEDVGCNPTRSAILPVMTTLGARLRVDGLREECNEPLASIHVSGATGPAARAQGGPLVLGGSIIPQLIDELPALAVVGTQVTDGLIIRDAKELRVKESDRIRTTVENLRAMGAEVEEYEDGLFIAGRTRLRGARLNAHGDHRIAMAFTVAALAAEGDSELEGAESVGVSFPGFFELLESVIER